MLVKMPHTPDSPIPFDTKGPFGTVLTMILAAITKSTADSLTAIITILVGTVTFIYTCCKIYEWYWKFRRKVKYEKKSKNIFKPKNNES